MRMLQSILTALVCASICGCETTNTARKDSSQRSASTIYVHPFTKFSFPESIATFRRVNIHKYDREGKDVGVGYNSATPIAATVYVYPAPKDFAVLPSPKPNGLGEELLDHHFNACKQEVFRNHPDAKLISENPCKIVQGNNLYQGKKATFSMSYKFGFFNQESVSQLYVFLMEPNIKFFLTDRQFVKYRITYPVAKKAQAETEVATFMADLIWPTK